MSRRTWPLAALFLAACAGQPTPSAVPASDQPAAPRPSTTSIAGPTDVPASSDDAWDLLGEAPFARLEMAVTAHDGRIWLAGGLSPVGGALADVEVFDPATGEWADGPSLPAGVHHTALVSDGDRLLLLGGYVGDDFSRPSDLVLVLDEEAQTWAEGPPLPEARAAGAAAFDGSRVVYAGGVGPTGVVADVFGLSDGAWNRIGTMARSREHLAATSDGAGTVWLMGGRVGTLDSNMANVEIVTGDGIEHIGLLPTPRGGVAAFHADAYGACLTGGEAPSQAYALVECMDRDGAITTLPELNEPHHGHGAAVVDGVAYVLLGGPQPTLSAGSTVEKLGVEP